MGTCLLDVAIQGQATENLHIYICRNEHCCIGPQAIIGRPGMKKLRLRDDPEADCIITKRTKEIVSLELGGVEELSDQLNTVDFPAHRKRPLQPSLWKLVMKDLEGLLRAGIICPYQSDFSPTDPSHPPDDPNDPPPGG